MTPIFKVGGQHTQQRKYTITSKYRWLLRKRRIHESLIEEIAKNGILAGGVWQNGGNGEGRSGGGYTTSHGMHIGNSGSTMLERMTVLWLWFSQ